MKIKMKNKLLASIMFALISLGMFGQGIPVSTEPELKNVVLEEYTGIYCTYCPDGHAIAAAIQENNPGRVNLINIHVGGYSNPSGGDPDFRTPFGTAIAAEAGVPFYPSGSINRRSWNGGASAIGRGEWNSKANIIMDEVSNVNVGVEADINVQNNLLTVHVEAYYTSDSTDNTNFLNIALLQNNTLGPQTGGGQGDEYNHMHRLVWLITGQWGEEITTTTSGTFVDRTFTYTIPGDYNDVPTIIDDMEIVAFITETHQDAPSGARAYPTFGTEDQLDNDAFLRYVVEPSPGCGGSFNPLVNVQNVGLNEITTLEFIYSMNGGNSQTYIWNGSIGIGGANLDIELPEIFYNNTPDNILEVMLSSADDNQDNDSTSISLPPAIISSETVNMSIRTFDTGATLSWQLTDSDNNILYSGGPYGNQETIEESFTNLPLNCYTFNIDDSDSNSGNASVVLRDSDYQFIVNCNQCVEDNLQVSFSPGVWVDVPINDLCVDAIIIDCGGVYDGQTITATNSGNDSAPDVWYSYTGSGEPKDIIISLCDGGTDYDSLLRVFDACDGTEIASNDDFCDLQSEVSFLSDGTSTYYIMVEGSGSNSGNFSLEVSCLLGTNDNTIEGFSFNPNPATNAINLSSIGNIERVTIYNILGQKVIDQDINATSSQLNVSNLVTGAYLMQVSVDGKTATYKVLKD